MPDYCYFNDFEDNKKHERRFQGVCHGKCAELDNDGQSHLRTNVGEDLPEEVRFGIAP